MEQPTTQEKIVLALGAISLMSNTLNQVNTEMRMQPFQGDFAQTFQERRERFHESIANRLTEIANSLGDYLNDADAVDENMMAVTTPIFDLLNYNACAHCGAHWDTASHNSCSCGAYLSKTDNRQKGGQP